jgi:catecholate siderophore receptor
VPQSVTIVTSALIRDQMMMSVGDVIRYVPGISVHQGENNRDQIIVRGNSSSADFFVDGVRDDVQYFRDFYNVDRVEVLKGPNAMIFGRGGGGGVINRVLKRPSLSSYRSLMGSGDGWGGFRLTGDADQPLSSVLGVRLNAMYEYGDSFRNHVDLKRYGINPTAALLVGPETRIDLSYEHFHDRRTADRGVPAHGDEPIRGFTRTFFGDPGISFARAGVDLATVAIEHDFGGALTLRNRTMFGNYDKFYQNVYGSGFSAATGLVSLSGYNNLNNRTNLFSQTDLVWQNRLAGIDQTLLFGFEVGREKSRNRHLTAILSQTTTPISDPTVDVDAIFAPAPSDANNRVKASVAAAYAQDQIRPADWLEVVAGVRFDSLKIEVDDLRAVGGGQFGRRDNLLSPRFGLILKPGQNLSFYASYSRSYLPQSGDQFSSLTDVTDGLKPERFDNYEVGAKWEILDGLLATAAVYRLDRTNTRAVDPLDPTHTVLTGAQRSRGIELGLERSITSRWMISGGYAFQDAKITAASAAGPAGRKVPLVPRHSFSLWNRYDIAPTVGVGLGVITRSKSFASISNAVKLPAYTRVDAAIYYKLPRGMEAQVNFENLLGAHYFPTASNDNNIAPGAPRSVKVTVGYRF